MEKSTTTYLVNNISLPYRASVQEAFSVAKKKLMQIGISTDRDSFYVYRRSVDARRRSDIRFVYSIAALSENPPRDASVLRSHGISIDCYSEPAITLGEKRVTAPVVVVGSGPAGLFSTLLLAEAGFPVIMLERGGSVEERKRAVEGFARDRQIDPSTNIQFGAGGAGTFSDGKLVTRINDSMSAYVLRRLVEFGAPDDILYIAKPHVGTDILSTVVNNIINRIKSLGGKVMFHTQMLSYKESSGRITSVVTNTGDIECSALVLAIGHSARDTYTELINRSVDIEAKDFSVGLRIEHLRESIDRGLYGDLASDPILPVGEYNLSYNTKARGVYTFCMCPGGEVVAAASEEGGVVVNGMSYHSRSGRNSNSAVCCSVFKSDYGATPMAAIEFQRRIEFSAFKSAGSDYSAPIITVGDFLSGECKTDPYDVIPTYMNGAGVSLVSPQKYLPEFITSSIRNAIVDFDKRIPGFSSPGAVLTGPETRTSAPIRIKRSAENKLATGYQNLYPCGEGAGYAGGITSAAIDGIKCALSFMSAHMP